MAATNKNLVLVIDDEPVIQQTLAALLDENTFDVSFADDGEQGFVMAQALLPDISSWMSCFPAWTVTKPAG